jgi:hypothetical protein
MGRYNWGDENTSAQALNLAGTKVLTHYKQFTGSNTRTLTPTLINDARFGYTSFFNSLGTLSAGSLDVISEIGIPNQNPGAEITWGIPNVVFNGGGFTAIGDANDVLSQSTTTPCKSSISYPGSMASIRLPSEASTTGKISTRWATSSHAGVFTFQATATTNPANGTGGYSFAEFC